MKPAYEVVQPPSALPAIERRRGIRFPDDTWQYSAFTERDRALLNSATHITLPPAPVDFLPPGQPPHTFLSSRRRWERVAWDDIEGRPEFLPIGPHRHTIDDIDNLRSVLNLETTARIAEDNLRVLKAGDTMTGALVLYGAPTIDLHAATKFYVDGLISTEASARSGADATKVAKAGDTMTGALVLYGAPTIDLHAATKLYVDTETARAEAAEALLAPQANPTFTGHVTVPSATASTDAVRLSDLTSAIGAYLPLTGGTMTGTIFSVPATTQQFIAGVWCDLSGCGAGYGLVAGNAYLDRTYNLFKYSETSAWLGAVGFATHYPAWNQCSIISSGTTASTAGTAFTPDAIATFSTSGVGIGTGTPGAYKLNVNGAGFFNTLTTPALILPTGAAAGYLLQSDASGNASWAAMAASLVYKGTWDASSNTPTLANGTGTGGWYYRCVAAGMVDFGAGNITFGVGDDAYYNGAVWELIPAYGYTLVTMTDSVLGGARVGGSLQINGGVLDVANADMGDITVSGTGSNAGKIWTIDPQVVTYAKIQDVSAQYKILGRVSAGTGSIEEIGMTGTGSVVMSASPTFTGHVTVPAATATTDAVRLSDLTSALGAYLPLTGGTMTGTIFSVPATTQQFTAGIWCDLSGCGAGYGLVAGNAYLDHTYNLFKYSETSAWLGAVGFATHYPAWNQCSIISSGTTASTAGTAFTPDAIATFSTSGVGIGKTPAYALDVNGDMAVSGVGRLTGGMYTPWIANLVDGCVRFVSDGTHQPYVALYDISGSIYIGLLHDGTKATLNTNSGPLYISPASGATVLVASGVDSALSVFDAAWAQCATISHNGTYGYLSTNAGDLNLLPYTGITISAGHIIPATNSADDLGSTTKHWRKLYVDAIEGGAFVTASYGGVNGRVPMFYSGIDIVPSSLASGPDGSVEYGYFSITDINVTTETDFLVTNALGQIHQRSTVPWASLINVPATFPPGPHNHDGLYLPEPGNPSVTGYVLSRTTYGALSWIAMTAPWPGFGTDHTHAAYGDHTHGYELGLGNPSVNGYVLSSTTVGVRSWVAQSNPFPGFGTDHTHAAYGDHTHGYEPALGNPSVNGYVLSSTTAGSRSWVPGGISGSGTSGYIPIFTSSSMLGNSLLSWSRPGSYDIVACNAILDMTGHNIAGVGNVLCSGVENTYGTLCLIYGNGCQLAIFGPAGIETIIDGTGVQSAYKALDGTAGATRNLVAGDLPQFKNGLYVGYTTGGGGGGGGISPGTPGRIPRYNMYGTDLENSDIQNTPGGYVTVATTLHVQNSNGTMFTVNTAADAPRFYVQDATIGILGTMTFGAVADATARTDSGYYMAIVVNGQNRYLKLYQ